MSDGLAKRMSEKLMCRRLETEDIETCAERRDRDGYPAEDCDMCVLMKNATPEAVAHMDACVNAFTGVPSEAVERIQKAGGVAKLIEAADYASHRLAMAANDSWRGGFKGCGDTHLKASDALKKFTGE